MIKDQFIFKKEKLTPGDIVEVPFGKEKVTGVVWPDKIFAPNDIKIKNIHKKIGKISLNKNFINFMKWFAMYNVTPLGLVLKMVIGGNKNLFIKNDKNFDLRIIKAKKFNLNSLVKKISGSKTKACLFSEIIFFILSKYTSVLPEPVVP